MAVPMLIYTTERILTLYDRNYKVEINKVTTHINIFMVILDFLDAFLFLVLDLQAVIYTGNVLALYMSKPSGFKYKSGMYLFVKCPDLSNFEW